MKIENAIKRLYEITTDLQKNNKPKKFTLDGRLVGDLGEVLAKNNYKIILFEKIEKLYDAHTETGGKKVQIKATFKDKITFPHSHVPVLFLAIKIYPDGSFDEIYNGPGEKLRCLVQNRKRPSNNLHLLTIESLRQISKTIPKKEKIKKR